MGLCKSVDQVIEMSATSNIEHDFPEVAIMFLEVINSCLINTDLFLKVSSNQNKNFFKLGVSLETILLKSF